MEAAHPPIPGLKETVMGMMKRVYWDNIVAIRPGVFPAAPRLVTPAAPDDYGMRRHADWWEANRDGLHWQPIASYARLDAGMALASPCVLRSAKAWTWGGWIDGEWRRVTEGASWSMPGFEPVEWADVDMDAAILLGQE